MGRVEKRGGEQRAEQVVFTHKARCRDCYRCLRVCPVKAIRLKDGQASVDDERCIGCGNCIRECPQGAKASRSDLGDAQRLLAADGTKVIASVAPSFAGIYLGWRRRRLPSALRRLGFARVEQTAAAATAVAQSVVEGWRGSRAQASDTPAICTACPAVVRYAERHRPAAVPWLTPVVSPMEAHARALKERFPAARVVFIGPCVAKKQERDDREERAKHRAEARGSAVDVVLTFAELDGWLAEQEISLATCEESDFDGRARGKARLFALPGGLLETGGLDSGLAGERPGGEAPNTLTVLGPDDLDDALISLEANPQPLLLEPLFCRHGCLGGAGIDSELSLLARRQALLEYGAEEARRDALASPSSPSISLAALTPSARRTRLGPGAALMVAEHRHRPAEGQPTEDEIQRILDETGKADPADHLDCGACGYGSCRDKAIAVVQGMAEAEMCLPRMRRLAEQRADRIIETSPNGILILDERLRVLHMNPSFRQLFRCGEGLVGKRVSALLDPDGFERLLAEDLGVLELTTHHPKIELHCRQLLYRLTDERQLVGIFVPLRRADEAQLEALRRETKARAEELLAHQVSMAQRMVSFLGESSAQGQTLVKNLLELAASSDEGVADVAQEVLPWPTRTSK